MDFGQVAQLITSVATLIGVAGSTAVSLRNSKKLEEVHKSTNGLAMRNEEIAKKLGVFEGTAVGLAEGRADK